ncbi:hypothetical protein DC498_24910 [Terrimonas sp.]|uniref:tetratricopeptide repeat protein n=1 Tax=Terrimonas sp. TaxID=1914338 RepID=UPI000D507D36|nr:hypothetical protein [Terrimonas sp.]PVD49462.1 hypothetical protein DC498_24910 [Terrimonas sp.]
MVQIISQTEDISWIEHTEKNAGLLTLAGKFSAARKLLSKLLKAIPKQDHLAIARIYHKIGNTYNQQWQFKAAEPFYEKAELALMKVKEPEQMWFGWIELQIDYSYVVMHLRKVVLYEQKKEKLKSAIEIYGNLSQKARYSYVIFTDILWKNGWYMLPDETIMICEGIINLAEKENNLAIKITLQNILAFTYLFRHDFQKSRKIALEILNTLGENGFGEEIVRAYCTICFSYRKERDIALAREWTAKAYKAADFNKNATFKYLMDSITSWIYLKEGNLQEAKKSAMRSLKEIIKYRYPFLAFSLLPLITIYTSENKIHKAIQFAFRMLAPNQQKVSDKINQPLKTTIMYWGKGDMKNAKNFLKDAIHHADENGFL